MATPDYLPLATPDYFPMATPDYFPMATPDSMSGRCRLCFFIRAYYMYYTILGSPHIGANITVTLSLVPITTHLPSNIQVSQSATRCMMTQKCSCACNAPYDLQCVASYQPPPSYFYPIGKTRASMHTEQSPFVSSPCVVSWHVCQSDLVYAISK